MYSKQLKKIIQSKKDNLIQDAVLVNIDTLNARLTAVEQEMEKIKAKQVKKIIRRIFKHER
jgi:uncharacterized small protein (DUF1192 family)